MSNQHHKFTAQQIRQFLLDCEDQTGVNPSIMYCQATGAPIGKLSQSTINLMFSMIPVEMSSEEIIDDLFIRTVSAMRPNPALNLIRLNTMTVAESLAPEMLCAMLLISKHGLHSHARQRQSTFSLNQQKIKLFKQIATLDFTQHDCQLFLHGLLTFEVQFGFRNRIANERAFPIWSILYHSSEIDKHAHAIKVDVDATQTQKDTLERKAKLHESWLANPGNKQMRGAMVSSFMRLPPATEAKRIIAEKAERKGQVRMMLRKLMAGEFQGVEFDAPSEPTIAKPANVFKFKIQQVKQGAQS